MCSPGKRGGKRGRDARVCSLVVWPAPLAQWTEQVPSKHKDGGSNPSRGTFVLSQDIVDRFLKLVRSASTAAELDQVAVEEALAELEAEPLTTRSDCGLSGAGPPDRN